MSKSKKKKVSKPSDDGVTVYEQSSDQFEGGDNFISYTWQDNAAQVWKYLVKHPYLDLTNKKVIANFYTPSSQDDMDLSKLALWIETDLVERNFYDEEDFFNRFISIFQKVVDTNFDQVTDYTRRLVLRCKHLVDYSKWLCYEMMPLKNNDSTQQTKASLNKQKNLTEAKRDEARLARERILETSSIIDAQGINLCRKFIKDLERAKITKDRNQISFFQVPVDERALSDYAVYVRKPMDLGTVKNKLEKTSPASTSSSSSGYTSKDIDPSTIEKYENYFEFLCDCRRIFSNAIKYNAAHIDSDSTGMSKQVHDAAITLQEKLEGLIPMFTVNLVDKVEILRHDLLDLDKKETKAKEANETVEKSVQEYQSEVQAVLLASDKAYAHDLDTLAKRKEIRLQMQLSSLGLGATTAQTSLSKSGSGAGSTGSKIQDDDETLDETQLLQTELLKGCHHHELGGVVSSLSSVAFDSTLLGGVIQVKQSLQQQQQQSSTTGLTGQTISRRFYHLIAFKKHLRDNSYKYFKTKSYCSTYSHTTNSLTTHKESRADGDDNINSNTCAGVRITTAADAVIKSGEDDESKSPVVSSQEINNTNTATDGSTTIVVTADMLEKNITIENAKKLIKFELLANVNKKRKLLSSSILMDSGEEDL